MKVLHLEPGDRGRMVWSNGPEWQWKEFTFVKSLGVKKWPNGNDNHTFHVRFDFDGSEREVNAALIEPIPPERRRHERGSMGMLPLAVVQAMKGEKSNGQST